MLKKFTFISGSIALLSLMACGDAGTTAGGTIDPNSIADASSSSEMSSSSVDPDVGGSSSSEMSSSSNDIPKNMSSSSVGGHDINPIPGSSSAVQEPSLLVKNSHFVCNHEYVELPETDDVNALRPVATIYEPDEEGFSFVDMGYVAEMPCGSYYENLKAVVSGDTLYVTGDFVDSFVDCICPTEMSFRVQNDPAFENVSWVSFDVRATLPLAKEKGVGEQSSSSLVQSSSSQEISLGPDLTALELNGYERGQCMKDGLAAKPVAKNAASELPEAKQITYLNGKTVLTLENVIDYCGIEAKVSQKMVGDTLMLDYYDQTNVTKCICNLEKIDFLLEPENTAAKYVMFKDVVYWIDVIMYEVDPEWDY